MTPACNGSNPFSPATFLKKYINECLGNRAFFLFQKNNIQRCDVNNRIIKKNKKYKKIKNRFPIKFLNLKIFRDINFFDCIFRLYNIYGGGKRNKKIA